MSDYSKLEARIEKLEDKLAPKNDLRTSNDLINQLIKTKEKLDYENEHRAQLDRAKAEQEQIALDNALKEDDTSILESMSSGFANAPLYREVKQIYDTWDMARDPDFDPIPHAMNMQDELGLDASLRLAGTQSRKEFNYYVSDYREQKLNTEIASKTDSGSISLLISNHITFEMVGVLLIMVIVLSYLKRKLKPRTQ